MPYASVKSVARPTGLLVLWVHREKAKLEMPRLREERL